MRPNTEADFWAKVFKDPLTGCWEWTASRVRGYGQIQMQGVMCKAHRVAYELCIGPIAEGLQLDHLCRNPGCVNPSHLEPVTSKENLYRAPNSQAALNHAKTHCLRGHRFDETNTYKYKGWRVCIACRRIATNQYRARKRASNQ